MPWLWQASDVIAGIWGARLQDGCAQSAGRVHASLPPFSVFNEELFFWVATMEGFRICCLYFSSSFVSELFQFAFSLSSLLRCPPLLHWVCVFSTATRSKVLLKQVWLRKLISVRTKWGIVTSHLYVSPGTFGYGPGVMRPFSLSVQREGYSKYCCKPRAAHIMHSQWRENMRPLFGMI